MDTEDPRHQEAMRPLREAGQGEAEGFEEAEKQLIENATHEADSNPDPMHMAGKPEDARAADAEYGEADQEGDPDA